MFKSNFSEEKKYRFDLRIKSEEQPKRKIKPARVKHK